MAMLITTLLDQELQVGEDRELHYYDIAILTTVYIILYLPHCMKEPHRTMHAPTSYFEKIYTMFRAALNVNYSVQQTIFTNWQESPSHIYLTCTECTCASHSGTLTSPYILQHCMQLSHNIDNNNNIIMMMSAKIQEPMIVKESPFIFELAISCSQYLHTAISTCSCINNHWYFCQERDHCGE